MANAEGIVMRLDSKTAWIKTVRQHECESCASKDSCQAPEAGGNQMEVCALNDIGAKTGDKVVIYFKSSSLIKLSFFLYVFPIFTLIIGAIIGNNIATFFNVNKSVMAVIIGFLFFGLAVVFIKIKGEGLAKKDKYRPRIIKII